MEIALRKINLNRNSFGFYDFEQKIFLASFHSLLDGVFTQKNRTCEGQFAYYRGELFYKQHEQVDDEKIDHNKATR